MLLKEATDASISFKNRRDARSRIEESCAASDKQTDNRKLLSLRLKKHKYAHLLCKSTNLNLLTKNILFLKILRRHLLLFLRTKVRYTTCDTPT